MNDSIPDPDDMPPEIDFSGGARGKFYRPDAQLKLPIYLDADVQAFLVDVAARKGVALSRRGADSVGRLGNQAAKAAGERGLRLDRGMDHLHAALQRWPSTLLTPSS